MSYLLDTDICVEILRKNEDIISKIKALAKDDRITTSVITAAELLSVANAASTNKEQRLSQVENFLEDVGVLPFDLSAADQYGKIWASLKFAGATLPERDLRVISIALSMDFVLVTQKVGNFSQVKDIKVEDWSFSEKEDESQKEDENGSEGGN